MEDMNNQTHSVTLTNEQIHDIVTASLYLAGRLNTGLSDDRELMVRLMDINDHLWDSSNHVGAY
jgi:hypothetical protein